jgi:hypothetical protein
MADTAAVPLEDVIDAVNNAAAKRIRELQAEVRRLQGELGRNARVKPLLATGFAQTPLKFRTLRSFLALSGGIFIQPIKVLHNLGNEKPTRQLELLLHEALDGGEYLLVDDVLASLDL